MVEALGDLITVWGGDHRRRREDEWSGDTWKEVTVTEIKVTVVFWRGSGMKSKRESWDKKGRICID